jgi:CrcB protein
MTRLLLVAAGGALGAALRYAIAGPIQRPLGDAFPLGTLAVNVLGCFLIGLLATLFNGPLRLGEGARLAILVGVLGGFTTFSAFGLETLHLVQRGHPGRAAAYVLASNALCLVACWVGWRVASLWTPAATSTPA